MSLSYTRKDGKVVRKSPKHGRPPIVAVLRFWKFVDRDGPVHLTLLTQCWLWRGARDADGYGHFRPDPRKRHTGAHRYSFELHGGVLKPGEQTLHRCDNPPCVNPHHLFGGTSQANNADKVAKHRHAHGARHGMARLTLAQVCALRALHEDGFTYREIAQALHLSADHVGRICRGESWGSAC